MAQIILSEEESELFNKYKKGVDTVIHRYPNHPIDGQYHISYIGKDKTIQDLSEYTNELEKELAKLKSRNLLDRIFNKH